MKHFFSFIITLGLLLSFSVPKTHARQSRRAVMQQGEELLREKADNHRMNSRQSLELTYKKRDVFLQGISFEHPEEWKVTMSASRKSKYGQYYSSDGEVISLYDEQYPEVYNMFIYSKQYNDVTTIDMVKKEWESAKKQPDHDNVYEYSHLGFIRELDVLSETETLYKGKPALEIEFTFNNWSKFWTTKQLIFPWGKRIYTIKYRKERDANDYFLEAYKHLLDSFIFHTKEPEFSTSESLSFSDLPFSHSHRRAIERLKELKILQGYEDGSIRPDNTINRAEFTKIIMSPPLVDEDETRACDTDSIFSDVSADAWFAPYVCTAKKRGLIGGYPDGTFRPDKEISFVEAAKIISSFYAGSNEEIDDVWYRPFVRYLEHKKAIPLSIRTLSSSITRGEMAEMIYRLHDDIEGETQFLDDME